MADFDFLTPAIILGFAGLVSGLMFQIFRERRDRKEEKRRQIERDDAQRRAFAEQVNTTVSNQAKDLKEKLDDKLDVIKASTSGLEKRFDRFEIVNRDEINGIKREIENLYDDLDKIDKQVQKGSESLVEIEKLRNKIELLERRVVDMEVRVSNREGYSSTRN